MVFYITIRHHLIGSFWSHAIPIKHPLNLEFMWGFFLRNRYLNEALHHWPGFKPMLLTFCLTFWSFVGMRIAIIREFFTRNKFSWMLKLQNYSFLSPLPPFNKMLLSILATIDSDNFRQEKNKKGKKIVRVWIHEICSWKSLGNSNECLCAWNQLYHVGLRHTTDSDTL